LENNVDKKAQKASEPVKTPLEIMQEGDPEIQVDMEIPAEICRVSSPNIASLDEKDEMKKSKCKHSTDLRFSQIKKEAIR
jgi:hypothetical protein